MSFGKAKRFNYKPTDPKPSPADYVFCTEFNRGCSISKSARFSNSKRNEGTCYVCPRMCYRHGRCSTPSSDDGCSARDFDELKRKIIEFDRNDIQRQSIRRRPSKTKENYTSQTKNKPSKIENRVKNDKMEDSLYESEEYFDDDYDSFTSSSELDELKKTEQYEFNEVCNALRRIQTRHSFRNQKKCANFEETIINKLDRIENSVEDVKDDLEKLHHKALINCEIKQNKAAEPVRSNIGYYVFKHQSVPEPKMEIENAISKAVGNIEEEFEKKRISTLSHNETQMRQLMDEIHNSSEKSAYHFKRLCRNISEKLKKDLTNKTIEEDLFNTSITPIVEFASDVENVSIAEEAKEIDNGNILNLFSDYQQDTAKFEKEFMDMMSKYNGTQQMLEVEGAIIDVLKDELADLKQSLNKPKVDSK